MNGVLYDGSAVLLALLLGGVSAWWAVGCGVRGGIRCGARHHFPGYGSVTANPYVRAQTQLAGPLALDRSEAIYFIGNGTRAEQIESARREIRITSLGRGESLEQPNELPVEE